MTNADEVKIAKAKLYNLKSGIEGLISLLDVGTLEPHQAIAGSIDLAQKAASDFSSQAVNVRN